MAMGMDITKPIINPCHPPKAEKISAAIVIITRILICSVNSFFGNRIVWSLDPDFKNLFYDGLF